MGRYGKDATSEEIEKNRRVPKTYSIPKYIADELDNCQNASALVTMFLEENIQRIGNLTLDTAIKARENRLKEEISKAAYDVFDESFKPIFEQIVIDTLKAYGYQVKTGDEI